MQPENHLRGVNFAPNLTFSIVDSGGVSGVLTANPINANVEGQGGNGGLRADRAL